MIRKYALSIAGAALLAGFVVLLFNSNAIAQKAPVEAALAPAVDVSPSFTYQGYLQQGGVAVTGTCDFEFRLFDALTAGTQIGTTQPVNGQAMNEGRFTVSLNFGATAINGQARWLQIAVRCPAGSGAFTTLAPRQVLTATPYALSLRPGAIVAGTVSSAGTLNLTNSGSSSGDSGLNVVSAPVGVLVGSASYIGVQVNSAGGAGVYVDSAGNNGLQVYSAGNNGLQVQSATTNGVLVDSALTGFRVNSASGHGVSVADAAINGVVVQSAGLDGLYVASAGQDGVHVNSADNGFQVQTATTNGIQVDSAGNNGVQINTASNNGVQVYSANGNGVRVNSAGSNGVLVDSAGVGVWVESTTSGGVFVRSAGTVGLQVQSSLNGVQVDNASGIGLAVGAAANGVQVNSASNWAGYFNGAIFSQTCTGCRLAMFGVNTGATALAPGDIVAIRGTRPGDAVGQPMLMEVGPARAGDPAVGVVYGRGEIVTNTLAGTDETNQLLAPREGEAKPGDYVHIILYGPVQVKASALAKAIATGDKLAVDGRGAARSLQTVEVSGVRLAESAPTIGIALGSLSANQDGLIWVLVNPQ